MQYGYYVNQKAFIDLGNEIDIKFDSKDPAIVSFIKEFAGTGELETKFINGKCFYWLSYSKLIKELPLLDIVTEDGMYRRLAKLCKADILVKHVENNNQTFFAFGENYKRLVKYYEKTQDVGGSVQKSEGVGFQTEGGSVQKSDNHNTINHNTLSLEEEPKNSEKINEPEFPIFQSEVFEMQREMNFPDLSLDEIKLELKTFYLAYPRAKEPTVFNFLKEKNQRKIRDKAINEKIAKPKFSNYPAKEKTSSGFVAKQVFRPYYREFKTRREYDQAVLEARNAGMIVELEPLPANAGEFWGENSNFSKELSGKFQIPKEEKVDTEKRKMELEKQLQNT
jgi:hypothetical protein